MYKSRVNAVFGAALQFSSSNPADGHKNANHPNCASNWIGYSRVSEAPILIAIRLRMDSLKCSKLYVIAKSMLKTAKEMTFVAV